MSTPIDQINKWLDDSESAKPLDCPWPADVWQMTPEQYCRLVPDEIERTAVSGYLMRRGWELAQERDAARTEIPATRSALRLAATELARFSADAHPDKRPYGSEVYDTLARIAEILGGDERG